LRSCCALSTSIVVRVLPPPRAARLSATLAARTQTPPSKTTLVPHWSPCAGDCRARLISDLFQHHASAMPLFACRVCERGTPSKWHINRPISKLDGGDVLSVELRLDGSAWICLHRDGRQNTALRDLDRGLGNVNMKPAPRIAGMFMASHFPCRSKRVRRADRRSRLESLRGASPMTCA